MDSDTAVSGASEVTVATPLTDCSVWVLSRLAREDCDGGGAELARLGALAAHPANAMESANALATP